MWAPPTSAATTKFGAASWILAMVEPKSETSSGKKLVASTVALALLDIVRHPFGGDLAVVVVGGQHVDLVAPLLHRVVDDRLDRLRRRRAGDEAIAVADAALIEDVVEIQRVAAAERLPDRFARRRGDAGVRHIDLVFAHELLGVFGVERDIRLAVVLLELDLAPEQAAGGVDFLDRQSHSPSRSACRRCRARRNCPRWQPSLIGASSAWTRKSGTPASTAVAPAVLSKVLRDIMQSVPSGSLMLGKPVQSLFARFGFARFSCPTVLSTRLVPDGCDGAKQNPARSNRRCCAAPEAAAPCRECCPSPD